MVAIKSFKIKSAWKLVRLVGKVNLFKMFLNYMKAFIQLDISLQT